MLPTLTKSSCSVVRKFVSASSTLMIGCGDIVSASRFHTGRMTAGKTVPSNLKGKGRPAQDWLTRQLNDPYVKKSRYDNYRARSAYKLIEIDDKLSLLKAGMKVVDCGAAPGSWTQVLVKRVNADGNMGASYARGTVISVDLIPFDPVPHSICLPEMNFLSKECSARLANLLRQANDDGSTSSEPDLTLQFPTGGPVLLDAVLSDMAPSASGLKDIDHETIVALCYAALAFGASHLAVGGSFVCKLWQGTRAAALRDDLARLFEKVQFVKPKASRDDSSEIFIVATKFRGIQK